MKSKYTLYLLLCLIVLNAIEYVLLFIFAFIYDFIDYNIEHDPTKSYSMYDKIIDSTLYGINFVALSRMVFYAPLWLIITSIFYLQISLKKNSLFLALYNCIIYICISALVSLCFPGIYRMFVSLIFIFMVLSTFLSPLIAYRIPIIRNVVINFNAEAQKQTNQ